MRLVITILSDQNIQLIEIGFFAQQLERVERDVAINQILHARLCLADIVDAAGDAQGLLFAIRGSHRDRIADARLGDLKGVSFDQQLAGGRRPCALLGVELADADIAIVFDDEEDQVAPFDRPCLDASGHGSARLGIAQIGIRLNGRKQVVVDRIRSQGGRSRVGRQIAFVQLAGQNRVARQDG